MKIELNFLTRDQIERLDELEWNVKKQGAFFRFKQTDFAKDAVWNALCEVAGCDKSQDLTLLFVATKQIS